MASLSEVCREAGVPLVADSTVVPFTSFDASKFGVDIEVISSTKYISGGATGVGGLIVDYGTFDWSRHPILRRWITDDVFAAFATRLRREIHRNIGAYMSPQAASM